MEQSGVALIAQGASAFDADMKSATNATNAFVDATEKGSGRVGAASQIMIGGLRQIGTIAVDELAKAAKATLAFVGDSIGVAGDFEAGMKRFQAVAGDAVDTKGLDQFKDLFISLGKELPVSTSEVEQAAIEMVSGGIDPAIVAAGGLEQSIKFAAASGLSLADAAATSAKFLAGWTSSAATTEEKVAFLALSTDTLTKAAAASSTTAAELRLGLFNTQGAAQALHASFEDVTATLAELAPAFESSAQAGTALNVFMTRLEPQTKPAIGAMRELGIITKDNQNLFFDAQGGFLGMGNAAQVLKDKMSGLSDEQKISELHTIFGNDAMKVANLLMIDGAAGLEAMRTKMNAANGVSATAALVQSGYNTALENTKGSAEALQITIGSALLPVLTDLLNNYIAPGVNAVTSFAESFFKMVPAIQASDDPIQTFINALKVAAPQFLDVISGIESFKDTVVSIAKPVIEMASVLADRLEPIVVSVGEAIQGLITDFSAGGQGADALGSALDDLNGVWTLSRKVVSDELAGYEAVAKAVLPQIQQFIADHGEEIQAFFKTTWDSIIDIVTLALKLYDSIVPPILNTIAGFINDHGEEIQKVLSGAWTIITSIITGTLDTIKGVIKLALDVIHGDWEAVWGDIQGIADTQIGAIQGAIGGFLNMIAGLFNTSMADIGKVWTNNWNMLVEIANKVGAKMIAAGANIVGGIVEGIKDNASKIYDVLSDIADGAVKAFLKAIGAGSPAVEFMPAGKYAIQGVMEGMEDMLPSLMGLVDQTGTNMIAALTKNISKGGDVIRKMMDDLTKDIKDIGDQINDAIADSFGATASIDRQMARNFDRMGDLGSDILAKYVEQSLAAEQKIAESFVDPAQGAKYFKMVSDNIFETAALKKKMDEATDEDERARLKAQWVLISRAQQAEMEQFKVTQQGQQAPQEDIAAQIADLFQSNEVARNLPGILQSTIVAELMGMLDQLRNAAPTPQQGYASPPASQGWQASNTTTSSNRTYNMPIYTNNTPAALQQSLAVLQASTP